MCTAEERKVLLSVPCPWCGAAEQEECYVREADVKHTKGTRRYSPRRITTLDGGAHDARWRIALSRPAGVVNVESIPETRVRPGDADTAAVVGAVAVLDRPW